MFRKMIEAAVEKALNRRTVRIDKHLTMAGSDTPFLEKMIETAVKKNLELHIIKPDNYLDLEGYNPLPVIMGHLYSWVFVPFKGKEILVEVRYCRSNQLPDVDKLSHLREESNNKKKLTHQEVIEVLNIQEECCKAILNRPTFDELVAAVYGKDNVMEERRRRLKGIKEQIETLSGPEKQQVQMEYNRAELFTGYILPDDTMIALTNIALGKDVSDIKKVTNEKLLAAYSKARLYHGRPSDYIAGIFTDGDRKNIDDYATMLGLEEESNIKKGINK